MSKKVLTFSLKTDDRNSVKAQKRKFLKFFAPVKNFLLIKYFFICDYIKIDHKNFVYGQFLLSNLNYLFKQS